MRNCCGRLHHAIILVDMSPVAPSMAAARTWERQEGRSARRSAPHRRPWAPPAHRFERGSECVSKAACFSLNSACCERYSKPSSGGRAIKSRGRRDANHALELVVTGQLARRRLAGPGVSFRIASYSMNIIAGPAVSMGPSCIISAALVQIRPCQ